MPEELVVIRTYSSALEADYSVAILREAGLSCLLLTHGAADVVGVPASETIALAVHARDVERAEEALSRVSGPQTT